MSVAHDLYAETNPAFGTYAIVGFCREYESVISTGPSIALVYLALPIALSQDTQNSFSHTNKKTGLISWLNKYPDVRLNLGLRLDASLEIVSESLKLALVAQAVVLSEDGNLNIGPEAPIKSPVTKLPQDPKKAIRRAERLGYWMGTSGSASSIFSAFGVTL